MIKASGIYMLGRALAALLTIASIAIFSRILAPGDYGVYTLAVTTSALFNALFCTWVTQSVFRLYAEEDAVRLQSTGLIALMGSAVVSVGGALAVILLSGRPVTGELAAGILMLLTGYSVYEYCNVQLTLLRQPHVFVQLQLVRLLAMLVLPLGAFLLFRRFDHFMLALGCSYWLPLLVPRFLSWTSGVSLRHVDRHLLASMARYGLPLSFSILLIQLGSSLDRYILGAKQGLGAVAGYAAGADLALFSIGMLASSLSQAYYPRLLHLHSRGSDEEQRQVYAEYILFFIGLLLPAAVGLYFVSGDLAGFIAGERIRADASLSLGVFAATAFFINFKSFVVDPRFQIAKETRLPLVNAVVMVGLLVAGCFLLIPSHGAAGAAWASLIAACAACLTALLLSTRVPGELPFPLADLGKIAVATAAMAGVLLGVDDRFPGVDAWPMALAMIGARIILGMTVYVVVLMILRFQPVYRVIARMMSFRTRPHSL